MVKMDLGSSNAQSSSTATVTSNHIAAYQGLIASLQGFSGTADLKGAAYDSAKTYASSVLVPLLQGAILLSEKIASSTAKLPSEYSNQVAPESLDSADLERQIATYTAAYNRANEWLTQEMKRDVVDDRNVLQAQKAMARHLAKKHELEEKLRKLLAFNNTSASLFSEVDGLFQAVSHGMSQVKAGFSSFDGTFKVPAKSDMSWATTITSSWKKQEVSYKTVKDKIVKGESLTSKDIEVIQTYGRLHPNETVSPKIVKAVNQYSMSNGSVSSLPEKNQKFSGLIDFISTNISVGISNFAGDSAGEALSQPIEKYGAAYAAKQATEIWENRYSTELRNGRIMGKTPGATKAAIDASNDTILGGTKVASTVLGEGVSFIGGTAVGVGLDMMQGDSAEEAWGKEITTGVVSGIATDAVISGITYTSAMLLGVATSEITIPAAAVVGVGILVGTGISYLNNWATDHFPELEKFEDNVGEAVVDTWNGLTTGIKGIFSW